MSLSNTHKCFFLFNLSLSSTLKCLFPVDGRISILFIVSMVFQHVGSGQLSPAQTSFNRYIAKNNSAIKHVLLKIDMVYSLTNQTRVTKIIDQSKWMTYVTKKYHWKVYFKGNRLLVKSLFYRRIHNYVFRE